MSSEGTYDGASYTGHYDYRLIFADLKTPSFDPNEDLLKESPAAALRAQVGEAVQRAAMTSLIPLSSVLSGNLTGTEPTLIDSLSAMARQLSQSLRKELQPILGSTAVTWPLASETLLIPWIEPRADVFYDAEKVSMSSGEVANVLGSAPHTDAFNQKVTNDVKALQTRLLGETGEPWFLLAARNFLFVAPQKSQLTLRILIGLKPYEGPFERSDSRVQFKKVVVPTSGGENPVAVLTFSLPLEGQAEPTLHMDFGAFEQFDGSTFKLTASSATKVVPRLEGQVNRSGAGWVALNFNFRALDFNLMTLQVSALDALLSPGIRVGGSNWVVGGIRADSVNSGFAAEINKTIDDQIKAAMTAGNDKILDGVLTKADMDQAFKVIFAREGTP